MNKNHWALIGLGSASVLGLSWLARRFSVETRLHVPNQHGIVEAEPEGLARAAGVTLEQYALASAMQSEEKTDRGRLAVGRAIWNAVRQDKDRIVKKLLPHGYFSSQDSGQYAATSRPPTARTLAMAAALMEGRVPDFVDHAVQWDAPKAIDHNHHLYLQDPKRYPHYRFSAAEIAQRRRADKAHEVRVPGIPDTRFWSYA